MTSTHYTLLDTIRSNLDNLSNIDIDFLNPTQNSNFLSSFSKTLELTSEFLKDTSKEDSLVEDFIKNRNELHNVFSNKLDQENLETKELEKKLDYEKKVNDEAVQRLEKTKNEISSGNFQSLMSRHEMVDRLRQWRHSCDLEKIEIQNLKCKLDILQDKIESSDIISSQNSEKNRLFYELLTSALKLTILSVDQEDNSNLAIFSESESGNDHVWHLFSSSKDPDLSTCDYLWNVVEKSLGFRLTALPQEPNTPLVNSLRLSSR